MTERAQEIIELGWLQWTTVSAATLSANCDQDQLNEEYYVVSTQSCDLAHGNFDNEPHVELVGFSLIDNIVTDFTRASNSRILHIKTSQGEDFFNLGFYIREKIILPRIKLSAFAPDEPFKFNRDVCLQLSTWLAAKYYRASFSDEFNDYWKRVLGKIKDKVGKSYKRFGDILTGVFVESQDLPLEEDFKASWLIIYSNRKVKAHEKKAEVLSFLSDWEENLETYLAKNGLEGTVSIQSTEEVTLEQLEGHKRIFLDDACFRDEEPGAVEHQMG